MNGFNFNVNTTHMYGFSFNVSTIDFNPYANEWVSFNVNTIGIPNVRTAP